VVMENALLPVTMHTTLVRGEGRAAAAVTQTHVSCASLELLRTYSLKGSKGRHRTINRLGGLTKGGGGGGGGNTHRNQGSGHDASLGGMSAPGSSGELALSPRESADVDVLRVASQTEARTRKSLASLQFESASVTAAMTAGVSPLHLMDLDYDEGQDRPILLPAVDTKHVLDMLERDFEFLKSIGAMNYSVHLGIYKNDGGPTGSGAATAEASAAAAAKAAGAASAARSGISSGIMVAAGTEDEAARELKRCLRRHNCFAGEAGTGQNKRKLVFTFGIHKIDTRYVLSVWLWFNICVWDTV
jgi:hypothetical protein